jgi:16S rRNA (guanine966-N2)-methyltransferase
MIITAGDLKGKKIHCPAGQEIRPTSSKIRQAIFNVLYSMGLDMQKVNILELFAGTGIVSFEAISRGAQKAVIVDNSYDSLNFAEKNIKHLGIKEKVTLVKHDALEYVKGNYLKSFNLVFMDPPYRYQQHIDVINELIPKIDDNAIVMVESGDALFKDGEPENIEVIKVKSWGQTFVTFMKKRRQ